MDKYNIGRTFDLADPYSGPVWNWMKRSFEQINPWSDEELTKKQKQLDYQKLTGQLTDQSITKENIPPELIQNFLSEFPEYNYIFEGASGGRVGYMGGGITGIRKPSALPPTGGPMSQGLRSLYINDRDY